jgi:enamine deaminase RidA (YjgF/YER057c/UK114 family)
MGRYDAAVASSGWVVTAGMTPRRDGVLVAQGRVGEAVDLDAARESAAVAAGNALAAAAETAGGLAAVEHVVSLTVYVACGPEFSDLGVVADAASERLELLLGSDVPRGARVTVGVQSLPGGAPVEVQLTVATSDRSATPA